VTSDILLYIGSTVIILWGLAHIAFTKGIVSGFEPISRDNKLVFTMEWIAEGLTLCFIGMLVLLITVLEGADNSVSIFVYRASAVMLIFMAVLSLLTGARTPNIPYKLCPPIFTTAAVLFILGSLL
jgi:hypothetical protein